MSSSAQEMIQKLSEQQALVKQTLKTIKKKDLSKLSESDLNAQFNVLITNKKKQLDFSQAQFGLLDYPPKILQAILKFIAPPYETITHLDISDNEIHELDESQFTVLTEALAMSNIRVLNLAGNKLSEMESARLRIFFQQTLLNQHLEELDLTDIGIDKIENIEDLILIFELISKHPNLKILKLCANGIGKLTNAHFAAIFRPLSNSQLLELDLGDNDLEELGISNIKTIFSPIAMSNIRSFYMPDNRLSNVQDPLLLEMLDYIMSSKISFLNLVGNNLETNLRFLSQLAKSEKLNDVFLVWPEKHADLSNAASAALQKLQKVLQANSSHPTTMAVEDNKPKLEASASAAAAGSILMHPQYHLGKRAAPYEAEGMKTALAKRARAVEDNKPKLEASASAAAAGSMTNAPTISFKKKNRTISS